MKISGRSVRLIPGALMILFGTVAAAMIPSAAEGSEPAAGAARPAGPDSAEAATDPIPDSLRGRSGKLMARFLSRTSGDMAIPVLDRYLGDSARASFAFIPLIPFESKSGGRIGSYRIGYFPGERRSVRSAAYRNPRGFIEVTPENQDTYVSEHFRLRDFLTKDQGNVWPKYLVLREDLIDKLELVIADLEDRGIDVERMVIMSGFRTPQYNARGLKAGRARDSRHQYGDAADVFVDNNGDGRMDDLNRDGRVDTRDVQVIAESVDRVERRHPDLMGGLGKYRANRVHGPFAHIDVRGHRARWG